MPAFRPGKPSWILGQSVPQVVLGLTVDLVWDVIEWEDPPLFDGTSTVIIDRPGLYLVGCNVTKGAAGSPGVPVVRIRRNGVTEVLNQQLNTAATLTMSLWRLLKCAEGDALLINVSFHATLPVSTSPGSTEFYGSRIGPERWT